METPSVTVHGAEIYIESEQDIAEEIYFDSLEYLACCVEAEAGNQGLLGKRMVFVLPLYPYFTKSQDYQPDCPRL